MAAEAGSSIKVPTVELGELGVQHTGEPSQQEWQRVTRQLDQALRETGCAYLTQHGLPDDLVNDVMSSGAAFFQLGMEEKMKWIQGKSSINGYVKNDGDRYSSESHDLKESFLFTPDEYSPVNKEPPPFKTTITPLYDLMRTLSTRLLGSISLCLGKPQDYLAKMHRDDVGRRFYRFNYYPETTKGRDDVTGFGAHTDFGTFTMVLSNGTGGFQVRDSAGRWMDVPVVPGAVLMMVGDFITERSNKRIKAPVFPLRCHTCHSYSKHAAKRGAALTQLTQLHRQHFAGRQRLGCHAAAVAVAPVEGHETTREPHVQAKTMAWILVKRQQWTSLSAA